MASYDGSRVLGVGYAGFPERMADSFFERPILNSPYELPRRHWELDDTGQPTEQVVETRRRVSFITPVPRPKKVKRAKQAELGLSDQQGLSDEKQKYDLIGIINDVRGYVDQWREFALRAQINADAWARLNSDVAPVRETQVRPDRRQGDQRPRRRGDERAQGE